ncbi:MAG: hypothetical protein LBT89_07430 [Planctomycetaceae bacterium]|jgi:hypothetical protein|nr:hypothetical protein [Planctomycetaceae bacterium]
MRTLFSVICLTCLCFAAFPVAAQERQKTANKPNTVSKQNVPIPAMQLEMRESLKRLPWDQLSVSDKLKIKKVVTRMPMFRKMPAQTVYADPEVYSFMLQHPDTVIAFWQHLGATQLSLRELKKDKYQVKETSGTEAVAEILYRSRDLCIVYAKGEYHGPFLAKPCTGEVLLFLRSKAARDQGGEPMIVCELDTVVALDNLGADMLAKMFYTSLGKIADDNFAQTVAFVSHFSKTAAKQPEGLKSTAKAVRSIRQDVAEELCGVIDRTALRAAKRNYVQNNQQRSPATVNQKPKVDVSGNTAAKSARQDYLDRQQEANTAVFEGDPFFAGDFEMVKKSAALKHKQSSSVEYQVTESVAEFTVEDDEPATLPPVIEDGYAPVFSPSVSASPVTAEPKKASRLTTVSPQEDINFDNLFIEEN